MKIAIVGSRDYKNLGDVALYVSESVSIPDDTTILSGGARGVDSEAEYAAIRRGLPVQVFHADWDKYGKQAGMIRNAEIVAAADIVVAFWDGKSKGTANTIQKALLAPNVIKVIVFKELP